MYAIVCTRLDLSQVVLIISRYKSDPMRGHWEAVKQVLQYIKGTTDVGLVFEKDYRVSRSECVGYIDSDYVGDLDKRQSITRYVFTLSQAPVSWHSILQSTIILSTIEAEYMTMMEVIKEVIWLQGLLDDLGIDQDLLKINCDSISAIYMAKNKCIMQE